LCFAYSLATRRKVAHTVLENPSFKFRVALFQFYGSQLVSIGTCFSVVHKCPRAGLQQTDTLKATSMYEIFSGLFFSGRYLLYTFYLSWKLFVDVSHRFGANIESLLRRNKYGTSCHCIWARRKQPLTREPRTRMRLEL